MKIYIYGKYVFHVCPNSDKTHLLLLKFTKDDIKLDWESNTKCKPTLHIFIIIPLCAKSTMQSKWSGSSTCQRTLQNIIRTTHNIIVFCTGMTTATIYYLEHQICHKNLLIHINSLLYSAYAVCITNFLLSHTSSLLTFDSVFRVPCTSFSLIVVVLKTAPCVLEKGFSCAACQCASLEKRLLLFLMLVDELWYGCCFVCATRWGIASYSTHFVCWRSTTTPVFITFILSLKAVQHWTHLQQKWNSTQPLRIHWMTTNLTANWVSLQKK